MKQFQKNVDVCQLISVITSICAPVLSLILPCNNVTTVIVSASLTLLIQFSAIILSSYASIISSNSKQHVASLITTIFANIVFLALLVWNLILITMATHAPTVR